MRGLRLTMRLGMIVGIGIATGPQALGAALLMWATCEWTDYLLRKDPR